MTLANRWGWLTNVQRWWHTLCRALKRIFQISIVIGCVGWVIYAAYTWVWPESTVTLSGVITYTNDRNDVIVAGTARNTGQFTLKDPVIGCAMNGESGTTIKTLTVTVFQDLPLDKDVFIGPVAVGKEPEQTKKISCFVASASHVWN